MTRDEIVDLIEEMGLEDEGIVLFDDMEPAFLGIAERFEPIVMRDGGVAGGTHRYFAVYSFEKMVETLLPDMTDEEARDYLEFNTVGLYAGENTPAIMRD